MTRAMSLERFYSLPSLVGTEPAGVVWAPDGAQAAFLWNDAGMPFRDLWRLPRAGGTPERLSALAGDLAAEAPDGIAEAVFLDPRDLAFVLAGRLYRLTPGAAAEEIALPGPVRRLCPRPAGGGLALVAGGAVWVWPPGQAPRPLWAPDPALQVEALGWSADGTTLAVLLADDRPVRRIRIAYDAGGIAHEDTRARAFPGDALLRRSFAVLGLDGAAPRHLALDDPEDAIWDWALSSDGRRLMVSSSELEIKHHRIQVFDLSSGQARVVWQVEDRVKIRPDWTVRWDAGDRALIFTTDALAGFNHLHRLPLDAADPARAKALTAGPWEVEGFEVSPAGEVWFVANVPHPAERQVYRLPAAGGAPVPVTRRPGTHRPVFAPDFGAAVDLFSDDGTPPELHLLDLDRPAAPRVVARPPLPEFAEYDWARVEYHAFASSVDGAALMARVLLPPDHDPSRRYPMIVGSVYSDGLVNRWGGRAAHPCWGVDNLLVSRGFIVVQPEIRGSFGRGRAWNLAMRHGYGRQDVEDVADCVRALVGRGLADPRRVGIWGSSYGGLVTLMSLFRKPGLYAAGVAGAPATNLFHAYPEQEWIIGPHSGPDFPARFGAQSALWHSAGLADPLMIIHGTRDDVVLYADTIALVERLIAANKAFELVTLPGAGHGWDKEGLAQTRFAYTKLVGFFERHVAGRGGGDSDRPPGLAAAAGQNG